MTKATARHILVKSEQTCQHIIDEIKAGNTNFSDAANEHSTCPSGKKGGELGEFQQGMMVPEFDKIVFNEKIGLYDKPVKTNFGYHAIEILSRED